MLTSDAGRENTQPYVSCVCRFLYSDEVHIGPETVMTTLYTAKKYAVPALEGHCVEFLTKHLRADNAFMLLTQVIGVSAWSFVSLTLSNPLTKLLAQHSLHAIMESDGAMQ